MIPVLTNKEINDPCFANKKIEAQRLMFELMSGLWGEGRFQFIHQGLPIKIY